MKNKKFEIQYRFHDDERWNFCQKYDNEPDAIANAKAWRRMFKKNEYRVVKTVWKSKK